MLQSVHIFRKDVRHLLPEIAVTLALFLAFAWAAPSHWTGSVYAGLLGLVALLLHVLLPIAWLVLISRCVHDESLIGDRQFWTSRPYNWPSLLGAKALFLLAFIYLPFLLVQVYLLHHSGLYPTQAVPALLHNLLLLTAYFVLPILVLAAVTDTFVRLALSLLAAIVYLLVLGGIIAWQTWGQMTLPHLSEIATGAIAILLAAILIFVYATRHTSHARLALAAVPLVLTLVFLAVPNSVVIRSVYPALAANVAPKLSALPDELRPKPSPLDPLQTLGGKVLLVLPMQVAGVDENTLLRVDGDSLSITGPNGLHWTSPWQLSSVQLNAGTPATFVQVPMPLSLFEKIRSTPVDLHLTLALDHLRVGPPYIVKANRLRFPIPGHGSCTFENPQDDPSPDAAQPICRFPLDTPPNTFIAASLSPGSCEAPPAAIGHGNLGQASGALAFDPVQTVSLTLTTDDPDPQHHYLLCPGNDVSVFQAKRQGHGSAVFDQKSILLDSYAARISQNSGRQPNLPPGFQLPSQSGPDAGSSAELPTAPAPQQHPTPTPQ